MGFVSQQSLCVLWRDSASITSTPVVNIAFLIAFHGQSSSVKATRRTRVLPRLICHVSLPKTALASWADSLNYVQLSAHRTAGFSTQIKRDPDRQSGPDKSLAYPVAGLALLAISLSLSLFLSISLSLSLSLSPPSGALLLQWNMWTLGNSRAPRA